MDMVSGNTEAPGLCSVSNSAQVTPIVSAGDSVTGYKMIPADPNNIPVYPEVCRQENTRLGFGASKPAAVCPFDSIKSGWATWINTLTNMSGALFSTPTFITCVGCLALTALCVPFSQMLSPFTHVAFSIYSP